MLSAKCYQKNKERLQKKARERYQNLSKEKKKAAIWSWMLKKSLRRQIIIIIIIIIILL